MLLGDVAPDFTAWTTLSGERPLHFHPWIDDSWCILFSHPADFTPVCTTELGRMARMADEFAKRDCKTIALSTDSLKSHWAWREDIREVCGAPVTFPIIADEDLVIARMYGMLDASALDAADAPSAHAKTAMPLTVRSVFIIDPAKRIRLMLTYPVAVGRNFDEILRALDALQLSDSFPIATPANWVPGDQVIVRYDVTDAEAERLFEDVTYVKPYLRYAEI